MFNNGLPDLSLFCCISLLFLPHCLSAHLTCVVCSSVIYPLCAMSIHCTVPLQPNSAAAQSSFYTHESLSTSTNTTTRTTTTTTTPISSLYRVFIASVHLVHAVFAMPLHADSAPLSSTSRVLCLIIIVILQLLWWFTPRVQHHCMLY
jgi:hypothetical protein